LEAELRRRSGALLLVTHDRYLLDRVATRIVELDRGALHSGHGSYPGYLKARALRGEQAAAAERRQANRARVELAWLRRGPQARTSKSRSRVERATALLQRDVAGPAQDLAIDLPSRRLGAKVVNLHNAGKRYGGRTVLRGVDAKLKAGDRIGIVGPNGSGKTTLLGLVAGRVQPDEGKVVVGETVVVGWYGQDPRPLDPRRRVLDAVSDVVGQTRLVDGATVTAGGLAERFLFTPQAQRAYLGELSGGERRRLELLLVLAEAPNVLLLDEPTNDLDLDTLGVLEEYLDDWPGVLLAASHDRFFLERAVDDVLGIEADGSVRHHPGGWAAYRQRQQQRPPAAREPNDRAQAPGRTARRPRLSYNEQRELGHLERRLPLLEERKAALAADLQRAGDDYQAATVTGAALAAVIGELETAEARWLELAEIAEG
ncbi:MAG: ABC-F family ATP-binding cassette domain-containing protein, partial [Euzebyales bacterium]|nr:ABC-F family ATP-binding cassette domain-containing protein [Euzebyales bacterium]